MGEPVNDEIKRWKRAGLALLVLGWLQSILFVSIVFIALIPYVQGKIQDSPASIRKFSYTMAGLVGLSFFQIKVGSAVRKHEEWARPAGIALASVMLLAFPVGTVVGGYILWYLIRGWKEEPPSVEKNQVF